MAETIEKQLDLLADVDKSEDTVAMPSPAPENKKEDIFAGIEDPDCQYCGDAPGGCAQCGFGRNKK